VDIHALNTAIEPWNIVDLMEREIPKAPCWIEPAILPKGAKLLFGGCAKVGKALRNDQRVLTSSGWVPIAQLRVGDSLVSVDGAPSKVEAKVSFDDKPMYRVTFADGREVVCADDHLWLINNSQMTGRRTTLCTTKELFSMVGITGNYRRLYIPRVSGDFGETASLTLAPYILGALLGDGGMTAGTVVLTTADQEIVDKFQDAFCGVLVPVGASPYGYRISDGGWLKQELIKLGLYGKRGEVKFVPKQYLCGSREQRLAVLRGLMDTDGYVGKNGSTDFCSTSKQLAQDVQELVWSLGGIASIKTKVPHCTYKGVKVTGKLAYLVRIRHDNPGELFTLSRKRVRCEKRHKKSRLFITKVEKLSSAAATCIQVSHPTGLFVTENYIVTHNSFIMLEIARALSQGQTPMSCPHLSIPNPAKILMIEQEIGPWGLQARANRIFAGENKELLRSNFHGISQIRGLRLDQPDATKWIADQIHSVQANVLFLDPIGKLHGYDENDAGQINRLMYKLEDILERCRDLGLSIVFSHHFAKPSRDPKIELTDEQLFSPYNFRGSTRWYDDPDTLITVNKLNILKPSTTHKWWAIKTRWECRQGEGPPEYMTFSINRYNNLRVVYEENLGQVPVKVQVSRRGAGLAEP
jgi:hypothetical protein